MLKITFWHCVVKLLNLTESRMFTNDVYFYVHHRDLDQSSVAPQPMKKRLTESHWSQYGYANEYSSGILAVVTKEDMLISQEYQLMTTTERLKLHG